MNFLPSACERKRSVASQLKHLIPIGLIGLLGSIGSASADTFPNISSETELLAAIDDASDNSDSDIIDLGGSTVVLTSELAIVAEAGNELVISNGTLERQSVSPAFRLVKITGSTGSTVTFDNMTLDNGLYETANGLSDEAGGAAIFSDGVDIDLIDAIFTNNEVRGAGTGGAVFLRDASIDAQRAQFIDNSAVGVGETSGGAFGSISALNITFRNSTFRQNSASRGGAIAPLNHQQATAIISSTFDRNQATELGGAIWNRSQLSVQTSTFFNNMAGTGGGALYLQPFFANDTTTLARNTFVNNTSTTRAGTLLFESTINRPEVQGNIFVSNSDTENCGETVTGSPALFLNGAFNISSDMSCGEATFVTDASSLFTTGTLASNGGATQTIALNAEDTTAIDRIEDTQLCPANAIDQRGESVVGNCDIGSYEFMPDITDGDGDGVNDDDDNCPFIPNVNQEDNDQDGQGDVCDNDDDNDGVLDDDDAFPLDDRETVDTDGDTVGNNADTDDDNDGTPDVTDAFPLDANESKDTDGDSIGNNGDFDDDADGQLDVDELECGSDPLDASSLSDDADGDGIPDCVDDTPLPETDGDGDGLNDGDDNCPSIPNVNQEDNDQDGQGDVCDNDDDNDGFLDDDDAFPFDVLEAVDTDGDTVGNNADTDDDNDGTPDVTDAFPLDANESKDTDGDSIGNNGDFDDDADGQLDVDELECGSDPLDASSLSDDADGDGVPDCVDDDVVTDVHPVTVYQHVNYRGHSLSVDVGDLTFEEIRHSAVGNDRISSIEIASGYQVLACQHARFRGRCETFTNDTSDLRRIGFNDVISSIRVSLAPPVTVYQHVNYRGNSLSVDVGDLSFYEIRRSSVGNDRISSIRIAPGYKVIACKHARFRGRCETFTNDTSDLRTIGFNDVISSLRVTAH